MDSDDLIAAALADYDDDLLAAVAAKLFRPRIGQPSDELIVRICQTQKNPPVVDRLLKNLPEAPRQLLAAIGRSRQPYWRVEDLLAISSSLGFTDGFSIVAAPLERGLVVAETSGGTPATIADFSRWFSMCGSMGRVYIPPSVSARAAALDLRIRPNEEIEAVAVNPLRSAICGDGLDWLLRLAAARQQVRIAPVKLTQSGTLYKRDLIRFTGESVLQSALEHGPAPTEAGLLALAWARAAGLIQFEEVLHSVGWPESWSNGLTMTALDLFAALFATNDWDPLLGDRNSEPAAVVSAGLLLLLLLADEPKAFHVASSLASWLWEHHPHWSGLLPKEAAKTRGTAWVEAYLQATILPLGVVEAIPHDSGHAYRLTDLGRHLLADGPLPAATPAYPQTLLMQPNGEILAYRQGLTPELIAKLSTFANWKQIGAACTLELTAESVMRGLEDGCTLSDIVQTLDRHSMKPTPPNVADLLRRWADKRERLLVYPSATLVEFTTAADLDAAIARGIVNVRLTERIGLTSDGAAPDFKHLRLIGNRDYESQPTTCVVAEDDGVTLRVDAAAADLLLDAEIARFAEPLPIVNGDARRYRMSPETLKVAAEQGQTLAALDEWFLARSGESLPAAAKLFLVPPFQSTILASRLLVIETPTSEIADGILQWPQTAGFAVKRLGPTAIVLEADKIAALSERLAVIGIHLDTDGCQEFEHFDGRPVAGEDHSEAAK